MGSQGASCFHTLTTETRDIPKAQWDDMRFGQICTNDPQGRTGETFADWKLVIQKLCKATKKCDYKTTKKLESFFLKVESFFLKVESFSNEAASQ